MADLISQKREFYEAASDVTNVPWKLLAATDIGIFNYNPSYDLVATVCSYYKLPFMLPDDSDIVKMTVHGHVLQSKSGNKLSKYMFYRDGDVIKEAIWRTTESPFSHYNSDPFIINPYDNIATFKHGDVEVVVKTPGIWTIYEHLLGYGNEEVSKVYVAGMRQITDSIRIDGLNVYIRTSKPVQKSVSSNEGPIQLYVNSKLHPIRYAWFTKDSLMVEL